MAIAVVLIVWENIVLEARSCSCQTSLAMVLQLLLDSLSLWLKVVAVPFYAYCLVSLPKVKLGVYVYRKIIYNMDTNFKFNFRNSVKKKKSFCA